MTLIFPHCDLDISSVQREVLSALEAMELSTLHCDKLTMVSPIPVFAGEEEDFLERHCGACLEQTGWRCLMLGSTGLPAACVDVKLADHPQCDQPHFMVRGQGPAVALQIVLATAQAEADRRQQDFEVRFISFPSVYVTALWLAGDENLFFPTRSGGGVRPDPAIYDSESLATLIKTQLQARG